MKSSSLFSSLSVVALMAAAAPASAQDCPIKVGVLHSLSGTMAISETTLKDTMLMLVDEPAAGMTPSEREHTTDLLRRAAETCAVVVVEHDMEFVRRLECKVTVLHEGAVLAEGSLNHVTRNQDVIDVYLGR